jgi:hypothetical protein
VQRAETTAAYDRNDQQNLAALNSANFSQAQNAALNDIAAQNAAKQFNTNLALNVGTANAGILNSAGQFNAGQNQSAGIFNAGQDLAAQQFNAGQNLAAQQDTFANRLAANNQTMDASALASNLANSRLALSANQAGMLSNVGAQQQQQQQAQDQAAYEAFLQQLQQASIAQQVRNQALGIIPIEQTTNSSSNSQTKTNPGIGGILGGIGSIGLGAAFLPQNSVGGGLLSGLFGATPSITGNGIDQSIFGNIPMAQLPMTQVNPYGQFGWA